MARPGLTGHRKFRRLVRVLGSPLLARGALELLWESCYESGDDYVGTADDIESLVGWKGEQGLLTRALVEAGAPEGQGFLEPVSGAVNGAPAYCVHDLWHHAPDYVRKRRERELARQQKEAPEQPVRRTAPRGDGSGTPPDWLPGVDRTPSPSPSPSPGSKNSAEPKTATTAQGTSESRARSFLCFPVIGSKDPTWQLSEAQVAEWATLFPGLDVHGEAKKALAWVQASPGRRKTARGMAKFLVGWFTRTVDSGRSRVTAAADPDPPPWSCPHTPKCLGRNACDVQQRIARGKGVA